MKQQLSLLLLFFIIFASIGCTEQLPKEKSYPRVYFPKKTYKKYISECDFEFEIPAYAQIQSKDFFRNQRLKGDSCWVNIVFPQFNGTLHISYKYFENTDTLLHLMEDNYRLTSKHTIKASYIKDSIIDNPKIKGLIYSVGGNAASDKQFVLTDQKNHFIRGAMYYDNQPNIDSMRPVIQFIDKDLLHLINSFSFY